MGSNNINPLELDDIISRIATLFMKPRERGMLAGTNVQNRDVVASGRSIRANALLHGAMQRFLLTKFPSITSMDQKIRQLVPPFWILATAMSNHATSEGRRDMASRLANHRYQDGTLAIEGEQQGFNPNNDFDYDTPHFARLEGDAYFYVAYTFHPDITLEQYFQKIADKNRIQWDVTRMFDPAAGLTAPQLLTLTFSHDDLAYYGY